MMADALLCFINSAGFAARPRTLVLPASPRQIAQTTVLFPVPFGPIITLSRGPGLNSTASYVLEKENNNHITRQGANCKSRG